MFKFLKKIFQGKNEASELVETPVEAEEVIESTHDYGMDTLGFALSSQDYGWSESKPHKKVILVNAKDCENKITVMGMVAAWKGTGHSEWEFLLAGWFVQAVLDALKKNETEADITNLFDRDLLARNDRVLTQEAIYAHLIPWFEIIEETENELRLKIKIA